MNNSYTDIRDRISEEPIWFDEHAVPRYCVFSPDETANIYADACCLVRIECQDCRHPFRVCFSETRMDRYVRARDYLHAQENHKPTNEELISEMDNSSLEAGIKRGQIHYGDPPNACPERCVAGATMNSIPICVLEFWKRDQFEWVRVSELEIEIPDRFGPVAQSG